MDSLPLVSPTRARVPAAKLAVPQRVPVRLQRTRLLERLEAARPDQLVLLSAPAGHGKTMLLAEFAAQHADRVAWIGLDAADRVDVEFWSAVLAALTGCPAVPCDSELRTLQLPVSPSTDLPFLAALTDALAVLPAPLILVLEDLHRIRGADSAAGLDALVRYLRGGLQLVVSTRSDPAISLSRLRLEGRVVEIRADDLAFTLDETSDLLSLLQVDLTQAQIALVQTQTGGWAAGVRLAALSLREAKDREAFLVDLAGNDRAIADYLVTEVLARMPAEVRELLSRLCVCEQVSAPLAIELSENPRAPELLAALEQDSSLVVGHGPGRQWFRMHPLLRAYLKADLRRRNPALKAVLYERAARWHADGGEPIEALNQALRSRNPELVEEVLRRHGVRLITAGQHRSLRAAHRSCTPAAVESDPRLCLVLALACQESGELAEGRALARQAVRDWPDKPDRELIWLRSLAEVGGAWLVGRPDVSPPVPLDTRRDATLEERVVEDLTRAAVAAAGGDTAAVRRHASAARQLAAQGSQRYLEARALMMGATAESLDGHVARAGRLAELADQVAPPESWQGTTDEVVTAVFRSYDALMQGNPIRARLLAEPASRFAADQGGRSVTLVTLGSMIASAADIDSGHDPQGGLQSLCAAREQCDLRGPQTSGLVVGVLWEHEAALRTGDSKHALECRTWLQTAFPGSGDLALLSAAAAVSRGRIDAAQAHLTDLLSGRRQPKIRWTLAAAAVMACSLAIRAGRPGDAERHLATALAECASGEVRRPLLQAPAEVIELLRSSAQLLGYEHEALVAAVLSARGAFDRPVTLTAREQEILDRLASLRSLDEIAAELWVSTNTVKTHVKAIYAKLQVNSRREAIAEARRRGLLRLAAEAAQLSQATRASPPGEVQDRR